MRIIHLMMMKKRERIWKLKIPNKSTIVYSWNVLLFTKIIIISVFLRVCYNFKRFKWKWVNGNVLRLDMNTKHTAYNRIYDRYFRLIFNPRIIINESFSHNFQVLLLLNNSKRYQHNDSYSELRSTNAYT